MLTRILRNSVVRSTVNRSFTTKSVPSTFTLSSTTTLNTSFKFNSNGLQKRTKFSIIPSNETEDWLLEDIDPSKLRLDHPGFPFSKMIDTTLPVFTAEEVSKHNRRDDCWLIINGKVYNVSSYVSLHPGGDAIMANAGKDSTEIFKNAPMSDNAYLIMKDFLIGYCHVHPRFDGSNEPVHEDH
ncbi:hypothetical protein CYY_003310 [Polysphondylium violaceum]|uniref:Cytochrome b5 heme-binding domain-containing protein n=1 Tax=Polysphondylium violaceum TaxID=133409 RepID=A0A8J4Q6Z5_9MYCE|nr:hypothetical protein CYY_003310 [Polysphondylium violaceum]